MNQLALYSGSFNPVHQGHLAVVDYLSSRDYDEVIILLENRRNLAGLVGFDDRKAMLRLGLGNRQAVLDKYDFQSEARVIDYQVVEDLFEIYGKGLKVDIVLGSDGITNLDQWQGLDYLLEHRVGFVWIKRAGYHHQSKQIQAKLRSIPSLRYQEVAMIDDLTSATQIRQQLANRQAPQGLSQPVLDYITKNQLFANSSRHL
ncbi:hypothetical protein KC853_00180 [Candidatus Saccharibacteria bacterium]|nr:hypothetical protein [Candidatus Saccharibacteria bacterium]MCB9835008.1 hypothetical protein [Candidatus Nomurabacteria bacterium]